MGCVEFLEVIGLLERPVLGAHAIFTEEDEMEILQRYNVVAIAHNPVSNAGDTAVVAPITKMRERGVTVGPAPDAFEMNMLETARFAVLINRVQTGQPDYLPAHNALAMATIEGAKALGLDNEIGSLEPGKRADVVIFDLERFHTQPARASIKDLLYYGHVGKVRTVIVDGKVLFDASEFMTVDAAEVKRMFLRSCSILEDRRHRN